MLTVYPDPCQFLQFTNLALLIFLVIRAEEVLRDVLLDPAVITPV